MRAMAGCQDRVESVRDVESFGRLAKNKTKKCRIQNVESVEGGKEM